MASTFTVPVQTLIDNLGRLPGIGPRSAQRLAFHLLKLPADEVERLATSITDAKTRVRFCDRCFNFAENELCPICADPRRDQSVICVVEESSDIIALERTGEYRGLYHVLMGVMNPMEGVGADQLKIRELAQRLVDDSVKEVIICTTPNPEGTVTAMFISRILKDFPVKVTRPASGLPVGSDLVYADPLTLGQALSGRREIDD
ncbi:MAG: recombination mediator RecR [Ilumatobacteraceae bacterium]